MDFIVKKKSSFTEEEIAARDISGIPDDWIIESYPYTGQALPAGFEIMSDTDIDLIKTNNQAAYDAWYSARFVVTAPPVEAPRNSIDIPIYEPSLRLGVAGADSLTIITHDWTDRTTWYQKATQQIDLALVQNSSTEYQAEEGKRFWVNIDGPKLTYDYKRLFLRDGSFAFEGDYRVVIKVDDIVANPTTYAVSFLDGKVTFGSPPSGAVTSTFYENDSIENPSEFLVKPVIGHVLYVEHVEIQFSRTLQFTDQMLFEVWAGGSMEDYGDFSNGYFEAGYGQNRSIYRSHRDLINWCNNQYPMIPACGELTDDILVYPFLFMVAIPLRYETGILFRMCLVNNTPLNGELSTATFYMEKVPE